MCTVILGVDRPLPGRLLLAANRDEAYARPSAPPGVLRAYPRVVGGRDLLSGGTWLAVRTDPPVRVAAILNRRPHGAEAPAPPGGLSRGLVCLEAATAPDLATAEELVERLVAHRTVAPFSLVLVEARAARVLYHDGEAVRAAPLAPGFHALTHGDADDPHDPRVAFALRAAARAEEAPGDADEILAQALRNHDGERTVCLHGEGYGTVSSALLDLDLVSGLGSWRFVADAPCLEPYEETAFLERGRSTASPSAPGAASS